MGSKFGHKFTKRKINRHGKQYRGFFMASSWGLSQVSSKQMLVLIYLPRKDKKVTQRYKPQQSWESKWGHCGRKAEVLTKCVSYARPARKMTVDLQVCI